MTHFGDITKLRGLLLPRVEVIIGGSPCQDLSVAGKRAGLAGERSGLFMEQIRVIKEMRKRDVEHGRTGADVYPRFMVWENVPGAFSSNGGEDFRAVLEETARIVEAGISIPRYEGGRWTKAGAIIGDCWSIAWRTHDAQYWGVPQRRRRISLVADFGGLTAPEILFESNGLRGNPTESGEEREGTPGDAALSTCPTIGYCLKARHDGSPEHEKGNWGGVIAVQECTGSLMAAGYSKLEVQEAMNDMYVIQGGGTTSQNSQGSGINKNVCFTLNALDRHAVAYDARGNGGGDIVNTLTGDHENRVTDYTALCVGRNANLHDPDIEERGGGATNA